jgi:disulfide bond formation protein DsbB
MPPLLATLDLRAMRDAGLVAGLLAALTVAGALIFEAVGYAPCKLCLQQRYAYYLAVPLAIGVVAAAPQRPQIARALLVLLGALFAANAGFGVYHSGAEWGWWPGPADCAPAAGQSALPGQAGSLLQQMQATRVVSCTEAALRILGLSLAGWSAIICAALSALTLRAAWRG